MAIDKNTENDTDTQDNKIEFFEKVKNLLMPALIIFSQVISPSNGIQAQESGTNTLCAYNTNVRPSPDIGSDPITTLKNQTVQPIGTTEDGIWYIIEHNGTTAYVAVSAVRQGECNIPENVAAGLVDSEYPVGSRVIGQVNFRILPSTIDLLNLLNLNPLQLPSGGLADDIQVSALSVTGQSQLADVIALSGYQFILGQDTQGRMGLVALNDNAGNAYGSVTNGETEAAVSVTSSNLSFINFNFPDSHVIYRQLNVGDSVWHDNRTITVHSSFRHDPTTKDAPLIFQYYIVFLGNAAGYGPADQIVELLQAQSPISISFGGKTYCSEIIYPDIPQDAGELLWNMPAGQGYLLLKVSQAADPTSNAVGSRMREC